MSTKANVNKFETNTGYEKTTEKMFTSVQVHAAISGTKTSKELGPAGIAFIVKAPEPSSISHQSLTSF